MEKKLLIQDIAEAIATKAGINKKKSEAFVKALFETIEQGLTEDKFVKIKGLGTFKVIAVGERESVNINTGERFFISGHDKITFTPETSLKDLVNRPFSHFQTVILNDETEIEELESVDDLAEEPQSETTENSKSTTNEKETQGNENNTLPSAKEVDTNVIEPQLSSHSTVETINGNIEKKCLSAPATEELATNPPFSQTEQAVEDKLDELSVSPATLAEEKEEEVSKDTTHDNIVTDEISENDTEATIETDVQDKENNDNIIPPTIATAEVSKDIVDQKVAITSSENTTNSNTEREIVVAEENALENANKTDSTNETIKVDESGVNEQLDNTIPQQQKKRSVWKRITFTLLIILVLLLTYFAGYFKVFCPCEFWNNKNIPENIPMILPIPEDSLYNTNDSTVSDTINTINENIDTLKTTQEQSTKNSKETTTVSPVKTQDIHQIPVTEATTKQISQTKEEKANFKQVQGGKYEITGTLRTHKIEKGETIRTIAQEVYGSKGYATYIITYNELVNPNLIDTGTVIKLPKLKRK